MLVVLSIPYFIAIPVLTLHMMALHAPDGWLAVARDAAVGLAVWAGPTWVVAGQVGWMSDGGRYRAGTGPVEGDMRPTPPENSRMPFLAVVGWLVAMGATASGLLALCARFMEGPPEGLVHRQLLCMAACLAFVAVLHAVNVGVPHDPRIDGREDGHRIATAAGTIFFLFCAFGVLLSFPVGAISFLMTALCTLATCVGVHLRLVCHALRTRPLGSAI